MLTWCLGPREYGVFMEERVQWWPGVRFAGRSKDAMKGESESATSTVLDFMSVWLERSGTGHESSRDSSTRRIEICIELLSLYDLWGNLFLFLFSYGDCGELQSALFFSERCPYQDRAMFSLNFSKSFESCCDVTRTMTCAHTCSYFPV